MAWALQGGGLNTLGLGLMICRIGTWDGVGNTNWFYIYFGSMICLLI